MSIDDVARYYDPATAQFLSVDPDVATTLSPYGYVDGDPLNSTDPSGLDNCGLFAFFCDAVATGAQWAWNHPAVVAGAVLGVAAAATGVGAIIEGATVAGVALGGGSVVLGGAAATLDYGPCVNGHDAVACLGLGLGATGAVTGVVATAGSGLVLGGVIAEDFLPAGILGGVGAFGWNIGVAGTLSDVALGIFGGSTSCP